MSCPIETHPLYATFRVRTIGVGRNCARGYLLPSEMSLQNRPNFRSNSTGKERDEETGYSYFGARYMDHALLTGWLSVDPMADKYPGISPYNYCMWNPIRVVDPNGMDT
ncbi:RHS repeat-associated core domain-containing protein, partial [Fibrobacter sp.]|uniref:RHS repeat-associated core domain-containing protein n=1 Tax=Fibrobacter sp. TaxID=35828 RepID=UPI00386D41E8